MTITCQFAGYIDVPVYEAPYRIVPTPAQPLAFGHNSIDSVSLSRTYTGTHQPTLEYAAFSGGYYLGYDGYTSYISTNNASNGGNREDITYYNGYYFRAVDNGNNNLGVLKINVSTDIGKSYTINTGQIRNDGPSQDTPGSNYGSIGSASTFDKTFALNMNTELGEGPFPCFLYGVQLSKVVRGYYLYDDSEMRIVSVFDVGSYFSYNTQLVGAQYCGAPYRGRYGRNNSIVLLSGGKTVIIDFNPVTYTSGPDVTDSHIEDINLDNAIYDAKFKANWYGFNGNLYGQAIMLFMNRAGNQGINYEVVLISPGGGQWKIVRFFPQTAVAASEVSYLSQNGGNLTGGCPFMIDRQGYFWLNSFRGGASNSIMLTSYSVNLDFNPREMSWNVPPVKLPCYNPCTPYFS